MHRNPNRGAPRNQGPPAPPAGRRGPFSLKSVFFGRFWPQEWFGWVRTALRIHLHQVPGETVDLTHFDWNLMFLAFNWDFAQLGFGLGLALDFGPNFGQGLTSPVADETTTLGTT